MGKGALPDDHPLTLGMTGFWGTEFVNRACLDADLILALGTRFKEADSSSWYHDYTFNIPPTRLIHIDIEPSEIGRNFPTDLGIVADLRSALRVLNTVARKLVTSQRRNDRLRDEIARQRQDFSESNRAAAASDAFPMMPERILADLRGVMPRDAYLTADVGWNKNGVGQQFPILAPGTVLFPGGFATMGFGPAAAIGAAAPRPESDLARRRRRFRPEPSVLATAREMDLGIVDRDEQ